MTETPNSGGSTEKPGLTITRTFDAPRELLFQLWIKPVHIRHWWGPRNYTTLSCEIDFREGGAWRVVSRHDDGSQTAERGVFRKIVEPERLVFTHAWEDEDGKPGHETLVTLTFEEENGRTRLTFHQAPFISVESRDGHLEGWSQSFDMLAEYLARV